MANKATLDLIVKYEGIKLTAYQDTGGVWTIGVGHTSDEYCKVYKGLTITEDKAYDLLNYDLKQAETTVDRLVKVPINANQRGALTSFTFNLGGGAFASSTLLRKLNAGDYKSVPFELNKWIHDDGKVLNGLVKRRAAEGELWNTPVSATEAPQKPINTPPISDTPTPEKLSVQPPIPDVEPIPEQPKTSIFQFIIDLFLMLLKGSK